MNAHAAVQPSVPIGSGIAQTVDDAEGDVLEACGSSGIFGTEEAVRKAVGEQVEQIQLFLRSRFFRTAEGAFHIAVFQQGIPGQDHGRDIGVVLL